MSFKCWSLIAVTCAVVANAHTVITYPGWRGNNLGTSDAYPYGMQWGYPCGGTAPTTNRTKWPTTGGAIAIQPGWFTGHETALFYINLGLGTDGPGGNPPNTSFPMVGPFEVIGPSNNPYPGTFCLPQVPLPSGIVVEVGDEATIQVVETAEHGGALYNCVDITFALPSDVADVNATNCFNSSTISFADPFSNASCTTSSENSSESIYPTGTSFFLPTSCAPCPTSTVSAAATTCPACPKTNGEAGMTNWKEGLGMGVPLGVLALGVLGI